MMSAVCPQHMETRWCIEGVAITGMCSSSGDTSAEWFEGFPL